MTDAQLLLKDAQNRYENIVSDPNSSSILKRISSGYFSSPEYRILEPVTLFGLRLRYRKLPYIYKTEYIFEHGKISVEIDTFKGYYYIGDFTPSKSVYRFEKELAEFRVNKAISKAARKLRRKERKMKSKNLNVVQEVGRDPLRIPDSTPVEDTMDD